MVEHVLAPDLTAPLTPLTAPSEAYRSVEEIRGVADVKATEIYASAYNPSPEAVAFYEFARTMQSYKSIIAENTTPILSTDSDLFKFLRGMDPNVGIFAAQRSAESQWQFTPVVNESHRGLAQDGESRTKLVQEERRSMLCPYGPTATVGDDRADDIVYPSTIPFLLVHLACFTAIWTGVTAGALVLCGALYVLRMFAIGAGYHRYFAHRAYKTSRAVQFLLAVLAQSSAQRGVLWWAAKHRRHHSHSDTELDMHSPRQHGFLRAHVGWIFTPRHGATDYDAIADFARYPELVWLDRQPYLPAALLGLLTWLIAGWPGLVVGFSWSTVLVWHGTFAINSVAHVAGRRRYVTGDDSRNNWLLAILTMGEGWHNNHHAYQSSVRQGFRWWEYDPTFYALKVLSWFGIVWDLQTPPRTVVRGEQRLGRKVIEKVARQLAGAFPIERIAAQAHETLAHMPTWAELRSRGRVARGHAEAFLAEIHLPHMPSVEEIRGYAEQHLARTVSLDEIARRTRQVLLEAIAVRLLDDAGTARGAVIGPAPAH